MIGFFVILLMVLSIISGIYTGNIEAVSAAAIGSATKSMELIVTIAASMALWGGIMKIAEKSGITLFISKLISPIIVRIFPQIEYNTKAKNSIAMNITANLFGIGNAATPLGITAVEEIDKKPSPYKNQNIAMLVVINTTSIQIIPSTIAAIRLSHGAANPFDITVPILITSVISAFAGCIMVKILYNEKQIKA